MYDDNLNPPTPADSTVFSINYGSSNNFISISTQNPLKEGLYNLKYRAYITNRRDSQQVPLE